MSKRVQYAHSYPVLPSAPSPETERVVFYAKADGLYARLPDTTEIALGGGTANAVTTDTTQTITGDKDFTGALTTDGVAVVRSDDARLSDARTPTSHVHAYEPSGAVASHSSDTTDIHGIVDTSALVLTTDTRLSDARTPTEHAHSYEPAGAVATHSSDTTAVHGITDTANLVYTDDTRLSDARTPTAHAHSYEPAGAVATHSSDTTDVHGIADTSALVLTDDTRLSNSRTPTSHAATHSDGGTDEITIAQSQVTNLTTDLGNKYSSANPPPYPVTSVNNTTGAVTVSTATIGAIPATALGTASGVATLDSNGKLVATQIPAIAITDTHPVSSQAQMLALTAQTGDVAVRSDTNQSFILRGADASVLGDWELLRSPTDQVTSVNGRAGVVTGLAEDNAVVHLAGSETVSGDKNFTGALTKSGSAVVITTDSRLSDARTPTAHSHVVGDLSATGTPSSTNFLRGDGTWAQPAVPANMVTTDTTQDITSSKTLKNDFKFAPADFNSDTPSPHLRFESYGSPLSVKEASLYLRPDGVLRFEAIAGVSSSGGLTAATGGVWDGANRVYSAGNAPVAILTVEPYIMSVTGSLSVMTGKSEIELEGNYAVESIRARVSTAPTGSSVIVDVNKNGTSIFTTQATRPTIAAGAKRSSNTTPQVTTFSAGDVLTVDVDQVGSTIPGDTLTITIRMRRTS